MQHLSTASVFHHSFICLLLLPESLHTHLRWNGTSYYEYVENVIMV